MEQSTTTLSRKMEMKGSVDAICVQNIWRICGAIAVQTVVVVGGYTVTD